MTGWIGKWRRSIAARPREAQALTGAGVMGLVLAAIGGALYAVRLDPVAFPFGFAALVLLFVVVPVLWLVAIVSTADAVSRQLSEDQQPHS